MKLSEDVKENIMIAAIIIITVTIVCGTIVYSYGAGEKMDEGRSEKKSESLREERLKMQRGEILEIAGMRYKIFYGADGVSWVINLTNDSLDKMFMEGELK